MLNKFVAVLLERVSGNAAFICQRHYVQDLINELGLNSVNNTTLTYSKAFKPVDKIVSAYKIFLKNKFSFKVTEINKKLPNINWTPKLHENPTKASFIIIVPKY